MSYYYDDEEGCRETSPLQEFRPDLRALSEDVYPQSLPPEPQRSSNRCKLRVSPDLEVIVPGLQSHAHSLFDDCGSSSSCEQSSPNMTDRPVPIDPGDGMHAVASNQPKAMLVNDARPPRQPHPDSRSGTEPLPDSARVDAPVVISHNVQSIAAAAAHDLAVRDRLDSARNTAAHDSTAQQSARHSPRLTIETRVPAPEASVAQGAIDQIPISPSLLRHRVEKPEADAEKLPALQPSSPTSPSLDRLPSFKQFTGEIHSHSKQTQAQSQLKELAEVAVQQGSAMPYPTQPGQTFTTATSPTLSNYPYPASSQTSPATHSLYALRSPTSTAGEAAPQYGSPTKYSSYIGPYADRRPSSARENCPPSLPSASSSAESYMHAGSSTEGYSTSHTTPIEMMALPTVDGTPRPVLPPMPGLHNNPMIIQGNYPCDFDGCTAQPFQTQYLLNSHKNVHSSSRPHFCPVPECPRSEGGRGFKRKNEMIRHGLVHDSPGYICPFCSDREHRYPRPDNLQRHVRVHHVDKDRDDPALREVLAQRLEGTGKARRRRTNPVGTVT